MSNIIYNYDGISANTDDIDEENKDFRVITFTYNNVCSFTLSTDSVYKWTLRTLNDSEFNIKLSL